MAKKNSSSQAKTKMTNQSSKTSSITFASFDPDIIVSYGANTIDWNYLYNRSHNYKFNLDFDRAAFEPHTSVYGHVSATGIVNIDLADFIDMFPEVKVKTLSNFADHLGLLRSWKV